MEMLIVTGMSGSGKNTAFRILEDLGYFCVDNLPAGLIDGLLKVSYENPEKMDKVALGIDIRGGENIENVSETLRSLSEDSKEFRLLFMDASDECLTRRYQESRRLHPLSAECPDLLSAIHLERKKLEPLRERADFVIDTSHLLVSELHQRLREIFQEEKSFANLTITLMSFGYKYGIPPESDFVFDARFLPNPFYVPELREKTGNDDDVRAYVFSKEIAEAFSRDVADLIRKVIPDFISMGKNRILISVGCTGGRHRSVAVANRIYELLSGDTEYGLNRIHRDVQRTDRSK